MNIESRVKKCGECGVLYNKESVSYCPVCTRDAEYKKEVFLNVQNDSKIHEPEVKKPIKPRMINCRQCDLQVWREKPVCRNCVSKNAKTGYWMRRLIVLFRKKVAENML